MRAHSTGKRRISADALIAALALLAALPAIIAVWFALFAHIERRESEAIAAAVTANVNLARTFGEHVLDIVKVLDYQSSLLAADLERKGARGVDFGATRRHLANSMPYLLQISMFGTDGYIAASSRIFSREYRGDREHFRAHLTGDTHKLYIGKPLLVRATGRWSIPLSRRLNTPGGAFAGVVVLLVDPEYFARYFSTVSLGEHGVVTLLRDDGIVISRRKGQLVSYGADLSGTPVIKAVMAKHAGVQSAATIDGVSEVIAFDSVSDYPLKVVVGSSRESVLAQVESEKPTLYRIGGGITGGLLLLAYIIAMLIIRLKHANRELVHDLAQRKYAEDTRTRLASIVENSHDCVIGRDRDSIIVIWNSAAERLLGWTAQEAVGNRLKEIFPPEEQVTVSGNQQQVLSGNTVSYDAERMTKDGRRIAVSIGVSPIKDANGVIIGSAATLRDLTERKQIEERIQHVAHHDSLTGLPNRLLFNDRLAQAIVASKRDSSQFALLYLDLDHFKPVNDSLGHNAGDELLKSVADRIRGQVRDSDTVARVGGDEFTVILRDTTSRQAVAAVAEKIIAALATSFSLENRQHVVRIGTSIGIAIYPTDAVDAESLIKLADVSMYNAKKFRNCFQFTAVPARN
ncbi:MAG: diguanylate cyclase [Rhodocyclales bacterium]|nr:diguanylate cyclase [Rhodocyclales bacterium]